MTDTLTEVFCDKWFDTENTSSAIAVVYYSTEGRRLFVEFHNGTTAGYENVPADVYTALEELNNQRVNGNENASVGSYYNSWFRNKDYFAGLSTDDIEIVTPEDRERIDNLTKEQPQVIQANDVFIAPLQYLFSVAFESGDNVQSLAVKATSMDDAVYKFQEAINLLGWDPVKIVSVAQHFN